MKIIFKKLSPTHHSLVVKRDGAADEIQKCETKAFMPHDLIHFAYEKAANEHKGFRGKLADGASVSELSHDTISPESKLYQIEVIVGALTGYLTKGVGEKETINAISNLMSAYNLDVLPLTPELLQETKKQFASIWGERKALPFDHTMELDR